MELILEIGMINFLNKKLNSKNQQMTEFVEEFFQILEGDDDDDDECD